MNKGSRTRSLEVSELVIADIMYRLPNVTQDDIDYLKLHNPNIDINRFIKENTGAK